MVVSPIVFSVPKNIKCLSVVETNISLDAVGAPAIIVALVDVALAKSPSHSKADPPTINAISLDPKLSRAHKPGSVTLSVLAAGDPHPVH